MTEDDDVLEFVDAEQYADELCDRLVSEQFAVLHGQEEPRRQGQPRLDWFVRRVTDRGAEEADDAEFLAWNPLEEKLDAVGEPELLDTIESFDEARIVSLGDAPRWGDSSAYEPWQPITEDLSHERYGGYTDEPHAAIELGYEEWMEAVKEVLEYRVGPPIAWEYEKGTAYLWGPALDEELLRDLANACHDLERERADEGAYDIAQTADRAESKLHRAEIEQPEEVDQA